MLVIEPTEEMTLGPMKGICVFCGSHDGARPEYERAARDTGRELAERGLVLVYGGGKLGLMGKLADAALAVGGTVHGIMPRELALREQAHQQLTHLEIVDSLHQRKARMQELADAFVALPGGLGTTEEFTEAMTWAQLGLHRKLCGLVNTSGYFDAFLAHLETMCREAFLSSSFLHGRVQVAATISELLTSFEGSPSGAAASGLIDRKA